ncbi:unnamed protein product [Coregonus sp. 'balchen']|nr:unnamed protein product [Coregonus sp. 'balchen']
MCLPGSWLPVFLPTAQPNSTLCPGQASPSHTQRGRSPVPDIMTTGPSARYRPTWDLALDPLMSCKLCLGEFPCEQMTTISQLNAWWQQGACRGIGGCSLREAVCQLKEGEVALPQLVQCSVCRLEFCSSDDDDAPIKRCPKCKVYIERDEGCAQMMCKNCKHAFCWYCLESLDDDFLLIHYDKGPCRNKLGHSRASVIWHRTQVVGIFAGFGLLLLVASPFLLLATPFVLCCKCKCSKGDDDPLPT